MVLEDVRQFVERELLGDPRDFDQFCELPSGVSTRFREAGLANWWLPQALGGRGLSLEESVGISSQLAYGDPGVAFGLFIPILGSTVVSCGGTDEQKERYLRPMARDGGVAALAASEIEAGSELLRMGTTAKRDGSSYVIDGDKAFSTNAGFADFTVVVAATPDEEQRFSAFIVERDTPGMKVVKRWRTWGLRASGTYQLRFEQCRVPEANRLKCDALRALEMALNASRVLMGATAIGVAERIMDYCFAYAKDKPLKNSTLARNSVFQAKLGEMEMCIESMSMVCRAAAREYDAQLQSVKEDADLVALKSCLVAKMLCGRMGWQVASTASEMFGGIGYTEDLPIDKFVRDMRYISIVEGGEDVLRDLLCTRHVVPRVRKRLRNQNVRVAPDESNGVSPTASANPAQ